MASEPPNYSPEQRAKNQLNIVLGTAIVLGVLLLSGLMQSWSAGSFIVGGAVILGIGGVCWWLFGSRGANPLPTDRKHARWPYLSKKTYDELGGPKSP